MLSLPSAPPHHGQLVSGNGDDAVFDALFLYSMTAFLACSMVLAVAERPTQRPTEKRTSPSFSGACFRSRSSAHTSVAARPS